MHIYTYTYIINYIYILIHIYLKKKQNMKAPGRFRLKSISQTQVTTHNGNCLEESLEAGKNKFNIIQVQNHQLTAVHDYSSMAVKFHKLIAKYGQIMPDIGEHRNILQYNRPSLTLLPLLLDNGNASKWLAEYDATRGSARGNHAECKRDRSKTFSTCWHFL